MTLAPRSVEKRLLPVLTSEGILTEQDVRKATAYSRKNKVSLRDAILDMKLARLTGLTRDELQTDYEDTRERVREYRAILADRALVMEFARRLVR